MKSRSGLVQGLRLCCLALVAGPSLAQAPPVRSEPRNQFEAGAWAVRHQGTLRAEPLFSNAATPAANVSLEADLGLKRNSTAYTLGYTRLIGQAWHFNAEYLRSSRSASTTTPRALQVGDLSVPLGTALQSDTNFIQASFAAGLALVQREGTEFGVRMGGVSVRTRVDVTSPSSGLPLSRTESDVLPMLGLYIHTRPGEHWRFEARVDAAAQDGAAHAVPRPERRAAGAERTLGQGRLRHHRQRPHRQGSRELPHVGAAAQRAPGLLSPRAQGRKALRGWCWRELTREG